MFKDLFTGLSKKLLEGLSLKKVLLIILGAAVCSFGIHNIHQRTAITEGGVIGMMLLIDRWLGLPPAVITPVLDITCYVLAFRYLGSRPCCRTCRRIRSRLPFWAASLSESA